MIFGGIQKFSLIDYPKKTCAILFTRGCNFLCGYCHNPELVLPDKFTKEIPLNEIYDFLNKRKNKLDAISITGGEPTLHKDLIDFLFNIKEMGFLIKLDSNGTNPKMLDKIISKKLVDYLAMDIKAPLIKYSQVINVKVNIENIKESINLIMNSNIDYEFRTTIVKSLLNKEDLIEISKIIKGSKIYFLQRFLPTKTLDIAFEKETSYSEEYLKNIIPEIKQNVKECFIR